MTKTRCLKKKQQLELSTGAIHLFHTWMGTIKDRNGKDLTKAEEIKRWQEDTEELYKKIILKTQITAMVCSLT